MEEFKVPKKLEEAFKTFLDVAQFNMPDSNDRGLSDDEQKVLKLVRKYLGKELSTRVDGSSL
jgi:hypothetical protein